jgi:hypothetical protein
MAVQALLLASKSDCGTHSTPPASTAAWYTLGAHVQVVLFSSCCAQFRACCASSMCFHPCAPDPAIPAANSQLQAVLLRGECHGAGVRDREPALQRHAGSSAWLLLPHGHCICVCEDCQQDTELGVRPGGL